MPIKVPRKQTPDDTEQRLFRVKHGINHLKLGDGTHGAVSPDRTVRQANVAEQLVQDRQKNPGDGLLLDVLREAAPEHLTPQLGAVWGQAADKRFAIIAEHY